MSEKIQHVNATGLAKQTTPMISKSRAEIMAVFFGNEIRQDISCLGLANREQQKKRILK